MRNLFCLKDQNSCNNFALTRKSRIQNIGGESHFHDFNLGILIDRANPYLLPVMATGHNP